MKRGLFAVWVVALICFVPPFSSIAIAPLGRNIAGLLLVVHAIECIVFLGTLRASGRPLANEIAQTMLYGVLHYRELKLLEERGGGRSDPVREPRGGIAAGGSVPFRRGGLLGGLGSRVDAHALVVGEAAAGRRPQKDGREQHGQSSVGIHRSTSQQVADANCVVRRERPADRGARSG